MAERELSIIVRAKGAQQSARDIGKVDVAVRGLSTRTIAVGTAIGRGIERLAEKGIGALASNLSKGQEALRMLQDVEAQTGAVIKSTGGKAGFTAAQIRALALAQEDLTTVDDKVIQSGENMLLTFTGIGKNVFPQATKAMVDMAVAMNGGNAEGIDLKSTAIQLGKALNDPIKGVGSLRRVGVQLTAQQEKQIKTLMKQGKLQEAQKIILGELTKEFGKAGEAAGKSGASGLRRLNDAVEDTQIQLAQGLAPALERIRTKIAAALNRPETQEAVRHLGEWLGDAAEKGLEFAEGIPWGQVADGLKTAAGFAGNLVKAFTNMPPEVQATILGLVGLNKLAGGGVIKVGVDLVESGIKSLFGQLISRGSPANPMFVVAEGGLGGGLGGVAGGGGKGLLSSAIKFIIPVAIGAEIGNELGKMLEPHIVAALNELNPKTNTSTKLGSVSGLGAAAAKAAEAERKNLQPLPDNISKKQERHFDRLRDKMESTKAATLTRLDQVRATEAAVRDRAEANRIATVTGSANIVAAIRGIRITNPITIVSSRSGTYVKTGSTLRRIGGAVAEGNLW